MIDLMTCIIAILIVIFIMTAVGLIAHFAYRILQVDKDLDDTDFPPF